MCGSSEPQSVSVSILFPLLYSSLCSQSLIAEDPEEDSNPLEGGRITNWMGSGYLETWVDQSTRLPSQPGSKCCSSLTEAKFLRFGEYYSSWSTLVTLFHFVLFLVSSDILNQV